jgi:hypothetical protein
MQKYEDLLEKAISRANNEISMRVCLEVEIAGLRKELRLAYEEISLLRTKMDK